MKLRLKILFILVTLAITVSLMSSTYSRYVADTTGNLEGQFANWKILVNENDITNGNSSSIQLTPVIYNNDNVASNKIAPSSKGYFDIVVDASTVEVSFDYEVTLDILNENIPDLLISEYSILNNNVNEDDDTVERISVVDNKIVGTLKYENPATSSDDVFMFEPFTIRVFFEWYDGETATMSDEMDTLIGTSENEVLQIQANIKFVQNISGESVVISSPSE